MNTNKIRLRKLQSKDAPLMFEWMQDPQIISNFQIDFTNASQKTADDFIAKYSASDNVTTKHYAIVNEEDEYLGTVSLKNIDYKNKNTEYAVVLRDKVIGTNVAFDATKALFDIVFKDLNLEKIYLNCLSDNQRAINFYKKMGFRFEGEFKKHVYIKNSFRNLSWMAFLKEDYEKTI